MTEDPTVFKLTASLLLEKLQHDFERMSFRPLDPFPAFDFIVTASHLVDWYAKERLGLKTRSVRDDLEAKHPELKLCRDLANAAKHRNNRPASPRTTVRLGSFSSAFSSGFDTSRLRVLVPIGLVDKLGDYVDALDLAAQVIAIWNAICPPLIETKPSATGDVV